MLKRDSDTGNVWEEIASNIDRRCAHSRHSGVWAGEVLEHLESAVGREAVVVVCFCAFVFLFG